MSNFTIEELERILTLHDAVIEQTLRVPMGQLTEEAKEAYRWIGDHGGEQFVRELAGLMRKLERLTAENRTLQAKIDAAMAIEERDDSYRAVNEVFNSGFNVARDEFRKVLEGKG